jgi:hypothetical protein
MNSIRLFDYGNSSIIGIVENEYQILNQLEGLKQTMLNSE